jgi:hypothetical protein
VKATRQITLSVALSLLASFGNGAGVLAATVYDSSSPVYIAQSLPPIQGGGYNSNQSYTNYGSNPQYSQQYAPQQYGQGQQYGQPYSQQPPLQGYVATAPAGTIVNATFTTPISSEYARVGDRFNATLGSPVAAGTSVLLPAGSQMEGQVVMVRPAGRAGRNGELEIRFTSATLPNGQRVPLSARIQTEDGTGIIKGGSTAGRVGRAALNTGVGAGLGAALGTAMGPLSGGEVGRGAIYGTILGAGMGALGSGIQKGKPAVLESGQPVNVVLDQPLTASPAAQDNASYQQVAPSYQYPSNPQPYNYYGQ